MADNEDDLLFDDDEEWEDIPDFGEMLYDKISGPIKQFLIDHYGARLNDAPAQVFRDIEETIKEDILMYSEDIPNLLYRHRTITEEAEWDRACAAFKPDNSVVYPWPAKTRWYQMPDEEEEEDDDDVDYDSMPEGAKKIIQAADNLLDDHRKFKDFMQQCCAVIVKQTQLYLEDAAAFDLHILSPAGFGAVQDGIYSLAETVAEDLNSITDEL